MRLSTPGALNRFGKRVTPLFGRAAVQLRLTGLIEISCAYLNCITGKGAGSGWDNGEEIAASRFIRREVPTILDVGANRGAWTLEMRRLLGGNGGRWILIDPAAECCQRLRQIEGAEVVEAAVGESPGTALFYTPGAGSVWGSLHKREDSFAKNRKMEQREVKVITIDQILAERNITEVDLLKMDLEGHELFALRGASDALKNRRLKAIAFEFGSANVNSRTFFRDFWDFLVGHGFKIARICPGGRATEVPEYYEDLEYFRGATNYIAVLK